jgi:hypothetical protein
VLAWGAVVAVWWRWEEPPPGAPPADLPLRVLLLFLVSNILIALFALPEVPGNPRYLLFLMAPLPILLAWSLVEPGW